MAMANTSQRGKFNPFRQIKEEWKQNAQQKLVKLESRNTTVQFLTPLISFMGKKVKKSS